MSKQTQGLAAVMPSTEELKTAGIRELSAEELLEVNGGRQVEGAINPYGPDPDIPDDPPSSSGSSSDYSSGSSGGSSSSSNTSDDSSSDSGSTETSSGSSIDSSSNTSEDTSSSSSSDTSDDNSSDSNSSSGSSSNASEDTSSSSTSDTSNDSSSDSNSSSGSSSNASEDTSSSSSSDTSNDSSSDSYEDEECGNYDNSSSDTGSNASENTSSNNSYSPDYEDEEPGSYDNSCNNPDAGSSDSSSSSSSYPDKDNNDSYAKNHSESSSGNSAETNHKGEAYIVQKGDTLSDIVRRHYPDASSDEIRRLVKETAKNSGITDVNKLEIGQTVFFTERQDGAKTGTKQAEANAESLKDQFKNISGEGNIQTVSPKEIKGVTRTIKHKNNVNIKGNTGGANPQQSIETEVKYVFVQGYSQLEFDKRYKFENGGHTQSCKTVASINEAMSKEELGEEKFYKVLDKCVQLWKDNKWIDKDGSPLDLDKMNLSLAKELEKETFSGFEFIKENTEWKRKKLTSDAFVESNSYDLGIGFWETADGGKHYMAMRKCDGYIMVIDSMDITRPRAGLYTPSTVEPYTQRTVGAI